MSCVQTNVWCPNITHPKLPGPIAVGIRGQGTNVLHPPGSVSHSGHPTALLWQPQQFQHMLKAQNILSSMKNKIFPRKVPNPFLSSLLLLIPPLGRVWGFFPKQLLSILPLHSPWVVFPLPVSKVLISGLHLRACSKSTAQESTWSCQDKGLPLLFGFLHLLPQAPSWVTLLGFSALNQ